MKVHGVITNNTYYLFICIHFVKVDFEDFQFLRIEPKVIKYLPGVATGLLGSGGASFFVFYIMS